MVLLISWAPRACQIGDQLDASTGYKSISCKVGRMPGKQATQGGPSTMGQATLKQLASHAARSLTENRETGKKIPAPTVANSLNQEYIRGIVPMQSGEP